MRSLRRSLPSLIVPILVALTLAACGGGAGGVLPIYPPDPVDPVDPDPVDPVDPDPVDPVDPVDPDPVDPVDPDPVDPVDPDPVDPDPVDPDPVDPVDPDPPSAAGQFAISGIDRIPQSALKLTKQQMQAKWVLAETSPDHGNLVALVACQSYAVDSPQCGAYDYSRKTLNADGTVSVQVGDSPFTELLNLRWKGGGDYPPVSTWFRREATEMGAKIVTSTDGSANAVFAHFRDSNPPYLVVQGAGNSRSDFSWLHERLTASQIQTVRNAVAANKLLFVAGYWRNGDGTYARHPRSSGCKDSELVDGCLWALFFFPGVSGGTSLSAPQVSGALASVLAVFPDTTPENLARFAKASAKRTGNGIPALLVQSGGVGVADFNSMGSILSALEDLPTGGSTDVSVNGQSVTVSGRRISLASVIRNSALTAPAVSPGQESSIPHEPNPLTLSGTEERDGVSFGFMPIDRDSAVVAVTRREGDLFASAALGTPDDFFGFTDGHGEVTEVNVTVGHRNMFAHFGRQWSDNGLSIGSARGDYVGFTAQKEMKVSEELSLSASAHANRFLGGEAEIPFGKAKLDAGEWSRHVGLAAEYTPRAGMTLGLNAGVLFPESEPSETSVGFQLRQSF